MVFKLWGVTSWGGGGATSWLRKERLVGWGRLVGLGG
jgi:hypothetical protein